MAANIILPLSSSLLFRLSCFSICLNIPRLDQLLEDVGEMSEAKHIVSDVVNTVIIVLVHSHHTVVSINTPASSLSDNLAFHLAARSSEPACCAVLFSQISFAGNLQIFSW